MSAGSNGYVATGSYGLALVNAPVSEADCAGANPAHRQQHRCVVDANLQIAAVASNAGGLNLIDVSNPMQPKLLRSINVNAAAVRVVDGVAYVAVWHWTAGL